MVKVHGKYITFCARLMTLYKDAQKKADEQLFNKIGKHYEELEPEGWYDIELIDLFMNAYKEASPTGRNAMVTMGRKIYPILKRTVGLPDFKSPLEAFQYESETFLMDHKSDENSVVIPRKILKSENGQVIIQAPSPGYDILLFKGVYIGILELFGIRTGKVELIDEAQGIFEITW